MEDDTSAGEVERVARIRGVGEVVEAAQTLPQVLQQVRGVVDAALVGLRAGDDGPSEIEIQFGVRLSAELGAVMTKAGGETTLQVRLLWQRTPGD